ncbi:hypothetical protein [Mycobacterium sp.]|uniref:hypothetical protein n=1 Tax=Mycobacterium sp. TaxID=1785 RepID=UPI003A890BC6
MGSVEATVETDEVPEAAEQDSVGAEQDSVGAEQDDSGTDGESAAAEQDDAGTDGESAAAEQDDAGRGRRWRRAARAAAAPRRGINHAIRGVVVLAAGAVVAWAGYAGWLQYQQHRTDMAAAQALEAAKAFAVTLTSTDPGAVDKNFDDILNGATGEFKDQYSKAGSVLRKAMIDNKVATKGTVLESAVKSANPRKVEVLLFVEQTVTNSTTPQPGVDVNAIAITMDKVGGRWLAGKVELPGQRR